MRKYDFASLFGFMIVLVMVALIVMVPIGIVIVIFNLIEYIPRIQLHISTWQGRVFYGVIFSIAAFFFDFIVDCIVESVLGPTKKLFEKITCVFIGLFSSFCFAWLFAVVTKTISGSPLGFVFLGIYLYICTFIADLLFEKIFKKRDRHGQRN
ncbi:hypothetical protein [Listeria fleischmannii]|uniref:Uncharacterized protein n=1 Tax=Listeria fleischmannii subsp. fleischmannii TaxID=1671902 RepID=A0A2X3HB84_9LIST|nr:hypothetical protein [Listeria fleischmannii]EMG29406.1 hypothetical protein LFLEISCH_00590 [Listeria fleischmannii subsp. fleischmannii LU2006-1]SQC71826.1 Uncharacterised protein [Listeria fleischmannii subsp. fleischmannii]